MKPGKSLSIILATIIDCGKGVTDASLKQWRWLGTFIARSTTHDISYKIIYNDAFLLPRRLSIESGYADLDRH